MELFVYKEVRTTTGECIFGGLMMVTGFGFEKFDSASAAQDAFKISPEWSDCRLRGEFDTLQVIDDMYVPKAYGDKGPGLDPFTRCYPEYGKGAF